jgi:hypothetical protein
MKAARHTAALLCVLAVLGRVVLAAGEPLLAINHIPLAVKDVDQAAETYQRLGFAIKPGRPHEDGIRTQLIKFPTDGAGIELITAPAATDPLTARYLRLIGQGEGPAFVCFVTHDMGVLQQRLAQQSEAYSLHDGMVEPQAPALSWLFIAGGDNLSPTDKPEHFAHVNTAYTTLAVWIAGGDQGHMRAFFARMGARLGRKRVHVPDPVMADVAEVAGGEVVFLPERRQLVPGRLIVGVSMGVRDLAAARRVLELAGIQPVVQPDASQPAVLIGPRDTYNVWLELREQQAR